MDKYIILSPEAKGSFNDRLNFLYLKLGNYLDTEKVENRTLQYCKVFLSDSQNQIKEFEESLLYQEFLKGASLTIVEQTPLNGSKVSLLIKTTDDATPILFHSLRLTEEEAKDKNSYEQTRMIFDKYQQAISKTGMTMERNLVRTWIYVAHIPRCSRSTQRCLRQRRSYRRYPLYSQYRYWRSNPRSPCNCLSTF